MRCEHVATCFLTCVNRELLLDTGHLAKHTWCKCMMHEVFCNFFQEPSDDPITAELVRNWDSWLHAIKKRVSALLVPKDLQNAKCGYRAQVLPGQWCACSTATRGFFRLKLSKARFSYKISLDKSEIWKSHHEAMISSIPFNPLAKVWFHCTSHFLCWFQVPAGEAEQWVWGMWGCEASDRLILFARNLCLWSGLAWNSNVICSHMFTYVPICSYMFIISNSKTLSLACFSWVFKFILGARCCKHCCGQSRLVPQRPRRDLSISVRGSCQRRQRQSFQFLIGASHRHRIFNSQTTDWRFVSW